jgi:hypothetical protein
MPPASPIAPRRLPETVRRRLEVATAMALEALIETHARNALQFITLMAERFSFDEALDRYLEEMDVTDSLAAASRTRVLVALDESDHDHHQAPRPRRRLLVAEEEAERPASSGWRRFRPDRVMKGVRDHFRRNEETERWVQLAIARAEEAVIATHVDNAITFAALLDGHLPLGKSVEEYVSAVSVTGGRAQAILQRTMARLADVHLPDVGR